MAIQDAYEQGLRSRYALLDGTQSVVDAQDNPVSLPPQIAEVYVLCLTLSPFPVVQHMLDSLLQKKSAEPYPVAMSVFDLDIVTTYLDQPLEFLHYIHHRVDAAEQIYGHNEVTWLANYLVMGTFVPSYVQRAILLDDFARLIDEDFPNVKGRRLFLARKLGFPTRARPGSFSSEERKSLVSASNNLRVRTNNRDRQRLIELLQSDPKSFPVESIVLVYDLSSDELEHFLQGVQGVRQWCRDHSEASFLARPPGGPPVGYMCFPDERPILKDEILLRALPLKHMAKADTWLGFIGRPSGPMLAETAVYLDDPWSPDRVLDQAMRKWLEPNSAPKKQGRNDPCWCQSGLKFKQCHGVTPLNPSRRDQPSSG